MNFEWDEGKSTRNAHQRGLPFAVAMAIFDGPMLEQPDRRRDYGEMRIKAIGAVEGRVVVCVYTDRGDRRRIISLRAAKRKERDAYHQAFPR
jgi:uncharacterized DUF497 family protein